MKDRVRSSLADKEVFQAAGGLERVVVELPVCEMARA